MIFDLIAHLRRQRTASLKNFGPGPRAAGVIAHIRKELLEIEADPTDVVEWIDVVTLAFDGALRQGHEPEAIVEAYEAKQTKNEARTWPDWRTLAPDAPIEHVRETADISVKQLIGLAGLKGSGKDTAASALDGFENVKMAGPLKAMLRTLLDYQGVDAETITRMIDGDLKEEPTPFLAGQSPRYAMQTLGTEWGRTIMADDIWIKMAEARCALFNQVVITDIRFPNEAVMVKRLGGVLVRIEREGRDAEAHPSEALVAHLPVDAVLVNDADAAETFAEDAGQFFAELLR